MPWLLREGSDLISDKTHRAHHGGYTCESYLEGAEHQEDYLEEGKTLKHPDRQVDGARGLFKISQICKHDEKRL